MTDFERVYSAVSLIPKGKVSTYAELARVTRLSARVVGFALHGNKEPLIIPCHRVIKSNGTLANGYVFGGKKEQIKKLVNEGLPVKQGSVDLEKYGFFYSKPLVFYLDLLFEFGYPGKWPWFQTGKPHTPDEIIIGCILTQNTNWRNVESAIDNLRKNNMNKLAQLYKTGNKNIDILKSLIRPSGYYNQKAERLVILTKFIIEKYKNTSNFFKRDTMKARRELLSLKGIGMETADAMLLYAADQPIFVVDAYTKRFIKTYRLTKKTSYEDIRTFFEKALKEIEDQKKAELYQNYHALIVKWAKTNSGKTV